MTSVEVEYCVPCGFLDHVEQLQHALLEQLGDRLDRVTLVTGNHGVLVVTVDNEHVWDKSEGELDPDLVLRRVRPRVGRAGRPVKSLKHAAVGAIARATAAVAADPPGSLPLLVADVVPVNVLVGLNYFVITRIQCGDRTNLWLAVVNSRIGFSDQERVFEEFNIGSNRKRLLSHHLIGGVAIGALTLLGLGLLTAFLMVVSCIYVVCDFLRDLGIT